MTDFYSNLLQRDVNFPEISPQGVQATKFVLKAMSSRFKKQKDKDKYIDQLRNGIPTKKGQSADRQRRQVSPEKPVQEKPNIPRQARLAIPGQVSTESSADMDICTDKTGPVSVAKTVVTSGQDFNTTVSDTELDIFHNGTEDEYSVA